MNNRPDAWTRAFEAAVATHRGGDFPKAIEQYRRLLKQRPADSGLLTNLATALKQSGQKEEALEVFVRAVKAKDAPAALWFNYGNLLAEMGDAAETESAWRRALELDPKLVPAATRLANLLSAQKRPDDAMEMHRRALAISPDNLPSLRALARLHYDRGEFEAAEPLYRHALGLAPDHDDTQNALGVVLKELARRDEAIACWNAVVARSPSYSAAHNNLGALYRLMHRRTEAASHLRRAIALAPRDEMAVANLAHVLLEQGQTTEAEALARGIVEHSPGHAEGRHMLGFTLAYQGRIEPAVAEFLEAHRLAPRSGAVISNALFASLYSDRRDAAGILALARELGARIEPAAPPRAAWKNARDPERRLRVGYLSPDFRAHPVSFFFEPVLAAHDRAAFDTVCYSTTAAPDAVTGRLRAAAGAWRDCSGWGDAKVAAQIESDAVDILVDLAGHTAQNRAAVLRARPAPVQALYIGYPGTTGLPEVDWIIADARICPPGAERHYSERVIRLDGSFWCFRPSSDAPAVAALPAAKNGYVTFGSYNALQKLTDSTVALWARVLQAAPSARLALKSLTFADEQARGVVRRRFVAAGIDPDRLEILPPTDPARFLAEYGRVDIGLDPAPYNGGTTTCEALWMGVPVVTLAGDRFCSRMGASLLECVGLPDLVAQSADDYVRIAEALATDLPRLTGLRASLRRRVAASPLCDAPRVAREVEGAYRAMWRTWLREIR
jgi:predicted O-linked N-acetylglucosamine transferase (SPINDLY family)